MYQTKVQFQRQTAQDLIYILYVPRSEVTCHYHYQIPEDNVYFAFTDKLIINPNYSIMPVWINGFSTRNP